jgi:hypothetical protein
MHMQDSPQNSLQYFKTREITRALGQKHTVPGFLKKGRFCFEYNLKMLVSENEHFRQEINADQRHGSFSALVS